MPARPLIFAVATLAFNTGIAAVLWMLSPGHSFGVHWLFAQSVGCSIAAVNGLAIHTMRGKRHTATVLLLTLPLGVVLGVSLAFKVTGYGAWHEAGVVKTLAIGLFFGVIGVIISILAHRVESEIQHRQLLRSESEKRAVEAQLKLLQAQIEPHFLFNTLANVGSLIDSDPRLARHLLDRLNDWLRLALTRARSAQTTLGEEIGLLENYLDILHIRFGERLRWRVEIAPALRRHPFPPMLLQPLVENAVRHGIEAKIGGGEIAIVADVEDGVLHIAVSDTGVGFGDGAQHAGAEQPAAGQGGTGLHNVRARLAALFGQQAALVMHGNAAGGATAALSLPLVEETA